MMIRHRETSKGMFTGFVNSAGMLLGLVGSYSGHFSKISHLQYYSNTYKIRNIYADMVLGGGSVGSVGWLHPLIRSVNRLYPGT